MARTPRTPRGRRTPEADSSWLGTAPEAEALEVPRRGTPDQLRRERRFTMVRWVVRLNFFLVPLFLVTLGMVLYNTYLRPPAAATTSLAASDTRAVATVAVQKWIATTPSPLPGGAVVAWDGSRIAYDPAATPKPGEQTRPTLEVHQFTLRDAAGKLYRSEVLVAMTAENGPEVLGRPSLFPLAPSGTALSDSKLWPDLATVAAPDTVETAVKVWSEAFFSGDPDRLRQVVADPSVGHSYMPMSGVALQSVTIQQSGALWPQGSEQAKSDRLPPMMVVNVRMTVMWNGATPAASSKDIPALDMDLLVSRSETATPVVVAWGGSGTGSTLQPYTNAVSGRTVKLATPSPRPTAYPSATGGGASSAAPTAGPAPGGQPSPSPVPAPSPPATPS